MLSTTVSQAGPRGSTPEMNNENGLLSEFCCSFCLVLYAPVRVGRVEQSGDDVGPTAVLSDPS